jgi:1,2-phenylacetyl-CoA epoxidase PaaB subunit
LREGDVPKSKNPRRREPPAWEVCRLKSSPAAFVGLVYAEDEEAALARAIEEHKIRPADQKRLFVRPR